MTPAQVEQHQLYAICALIRCAPCFDVLHALARGRGQVQYADLQREMAPERLDQAMRDGDGRYFKRKGGIVVSLQGDATADELMRRLK